MLGQPVSLMLVPQVVGFSSTGRLPEGATATDLVLTVTEMLRERGVVSKFVEFHGDGLANLPLADRATIGNRTSLEMGVDLAIFPVDAEDAPLSGVRAGRPRRVELVEAYCREQGLFHDEDFEDATYSDTLELALNGKRGAVARRAEAPAGPGGAHGRGVGLPRRAGGVHGPRDADRLRRGPRTADFPRADPPMNNGGGESPKVGHSHPQPGTAVAEREEGLRARSAVIAAITNGTNTSNPSVMIGARLLAKKAVEAGLERMPWVKTSLAPGSKVVTEYLAIRNRTKNPLFFFFLVEQRVAVLLRTLRRPRRSETRRTSCSARSTARTGVTTRQPTSASPTSRPPPRVRSPI